MNKVTLLKQNLKKKNKIKIRFKMVVKSPKYAYFCLLAENSAADFFFHQKMRKWYLGNYKNEG